MSCDFVLAEWPLLGPKGHSDTQRVKWLLYTEYGTATASTHDYNVGKVSELCSLAKTFITY
jgi:hypothetical protein